MQVPYFNVDIQEAEIAEVADTLRSGWLGAGKKTGLFEERFAAFEDATYAVATNSCTSALHLSVHTLGAGPGTAVLVPTHSWVSCAEAVWNTGGHPVLVDCLPDSLLMDMDDAARKLDMAKSGHIPGADGTRLKVVGMIVVNYAGLITDQHRLRAFADTHNLWWIADAAHSTGAQMLDQDGNWVGEGAGGADVRVYSFYPNKPMTTGDGGMITCNDEALAERLRRVANHGLSFSTWSGESRRDWDKQVLERGFKYTMTDISASLGLHQLSRARDTRDKRAEIAARYSAAFAKSNSLGLPPAPEDRKSSWHLYALRLLGARGEDRDNFINRARERGVDCRVQWRPLHAQPLLRKIGWDAEACPVSARTWPQLVSLPIYPALQDTQLELVTDTVLELAENPA